MRGVAALAAAAKLFCRRGYHGTAIHDILELSGAPRGSLYFHFPRGKEEIAEGAVALGSQAVLAFIAQAAATARDAESFAVALARGYGTWDAFHDACVKVAKGDDETKAEMDALDQIGDTVIEAIADYFGESHNRKMVERLVDEVTINDAEKPKTDTAVAGKTVVIAANQDTVFRRLCAATEAGVSEGIGIRGVRKAFGSAPGIVVALDGIDLDVRAGEFVSVVGPSGCGKSTLLRIIAGLETQDQGTITQDGRDVSRLPAIKRDYGIVFQSYALFPNLTIFDNVAYGLVNRRAGRERIKARFDLEEIEIPRHQRIVYQHQAATGASPSDAAPPVTDG